MNSPTLLTSFEVLHPSVKPIISILALMGPVSTLARLLNYITRAGLRTPNDTEYVTKSISALMQDLESKRLVDEAEKYCFNCPPWLREAAIQHAASSGQLQGLLRAFEVAEAHVEYGSVCRYQNAEEARRSVQAGLVRGCDPTTLQRYLKGSLQFAPCRERSLLLDICGTAFSPSFMNLLHPAVQEMVLVLLLDEVLQTFPPQDASGALIAFIDQKLKLQTDHPVPELAERYVQYLLQAGQFDAARQCLQQASVKQRQVWLAATNLLQGQLEPAIKEFEAAFKVFRTTCSPRNSVFTEWAGVLHVLAMLRNTEDKQTKKIATYIDTAMRTYDDYRPVFVHLRDLYQLQSAQTTTVQTSYVDPNFAFLTQFLLILIDRWLGQDINTLKYLKLCELHLTSQAAGLHFLATQIADLLSRLDQHVSPAERTSYANAAEQGCIQLGCDKMVDWFAPKEPWQRQLAALANMAAPTKDLKTAQTEPQTRLIWELLEGHKGKLSLTPKEQKRKGQSAWSSGRPVSLKRLSESRESVACLTAQDQLICSCIGKTSYGYYGSGEFELNSSLALLHLIDHPLVFLQTSPEVRVDIVRGAPELEIKKLDANSLSLRLQPAINSLSDSVVAIKETPSRWRVIQVTDEHRRIGSILGASLTVPVRAKDQVLEAIRGIAALITIQSDQDVLPSDVPQIDADTRLHVHLIPLGDGLKISLRVRPFRDTGPYYPPGTGADNVIADIDGKPLQARRQLVLEAAAVQTLHEKCPAWRDAPELHGDRLVEDAQDCLELLLQLQALADQVVLAWPQGEKFKVSPTLSGSHFSMSIKRQQDWFSVTGELQIDDQQVLDLQRLLDLTANAQGRFIHLGNNQFLALTDEFRRRLDDMRNFSEQRGKDLRVHALAAGALQELAEQAGKLKTDKFWKDHLAKLSSLDQLQPELPATLQANLRDYQVSGFEWLNRLAHWGVGACLADDMGLGKTLQALALLLSRAPQGPALVVAPTSVCTNWQSEVARFAPTLRVRLFGTGDRSETLANLQPLDLVLVSYGLLQQEAERFAAVPWHTLVLDEAQAIKNQATKRSQAAMALQADFRLILSGTPMENHLGELWNLFRFINPGLLGSLEQFNERYAGPIERQQNAQARNRLRKLISPFMLRRTKSQVLTELPSRTEILRPVELSTEEKALYEALRRQALERLAQAKDEAGNGQRYIEILAEIMKLRRMCCNPQLVAPELSLPSSKLAAFAELVDELLANHHKALVFSQFVDHLSLLRAHLDARGVRYQYLDGATPMQVRKQRVEAFQAGEGDVFLISLKAGGTGLNLTAADYVIHMDPWWNPAVEDQASDRAHRIGQTRPVTIYRLVAQDTIEEKIVDLHKTKRALADSLLEGSDLAAKMSADDMLALLQEQWQAQAA